jgi:hypothetical protein
MRSGSFLIVADMIEKKRLEKRGKHDNYSIGAITAI